MYILVTYDVNTEDKVGQRRLYRVAKLCKDYGIRVQNSVFECVVSEVQLIELTNKLENLMDKRNDNIRIYFLNKNENRRIISLGRDFSVNVESALVI